MKTLLSAFFVLSFFAGKSQTYIGVGNMGFFGSGVMDTIKAPILVTESKADGCPAKVKWVLCVRERMDYRGDPMPPGDYNSWYATIKYITLNKQPLSKSIIIWATEPKKN